MKRGLEGGDEPESKHRRDSDGGGEKRKMENLNETFSKKLKYSNYIVKLNSKIFHLFSHSNNQIVPYSSSEETVRKAINRDTK
jgi:hypothetical protein